MEEEFNLSEKREEIKNLLENTPLDFQSIKLIMDYIREQDKEFIKRLKEALLPIAYSNPKQNYTWQCHCKEIDKLAGLDLIEKGVEGKEGRDLV